jgi:hypothetical protein
MDKQLLSSLSLAVAAILAAGCSSAPKQSAEAAAKVEPAKEPAAPPEPIAAQSAFFAMYKPARTWATDVLPLVLASKEIPGIKNVDGKAAMWTGVFVSPSRREARTFTYAVADHGISIHKGLDTGVAQPWSAAAEKTQPFSAAEFSVNSDEAFKTAFKKAETWVSKHPDKNWTMVLTASKRMPQPTWAIMWGDQKSGYLGYVNAMTGVDATGK